MNSLLDTLNNCLSDNGKTIKDIVWIGCKEYIIPIDNFVSIAAKTYDCDIYSYDIPYDLIAVGDDFWIERVENEFKGSWWEYKYMPKIPNRIEKVNVLSTRNFNENDFKIIEEISRKNNFNDNYSQMWMIPFINN